MILQNPDDFSQRLVETIAWCKLRNRAASIKSNLRSSICEVLLYWVPPELVELIDFGIVVNPENCIDWAHSSAGDLTRESKELRILD